MTKSIIATATAAIAATALLSSAAEAGFGIRVGFGFGGGHAPYLTDYNKESAYEHKSARKRAYRAARRQEKAPAKITKKAVSSESVAKVEEPAPTQAAETENSSISVAKTEAQIETKTEIKADIKETATAKPVETASVGEPDAHSIDCKKFFPSVGMTLTVPCE